MKEAKDYVNCFVENCVSSTGISEDARNDLTKLLKQVQIDTYNEALDDAAKDIITENDAIDCGTGENLVYQESILKLKK